MTFIRYIVLIFTKKKKKKKKKNLFYSDTRSFTPCLSEKENKIRDAKGVLRDVHSIFITIFNNTKALKYLSNENM